MSNGDDVLDSWEEIDEAGLTSQLDQIKKQKDMNQLPVAMPSQNGMPLMMLMRSDDEYGTSYTQPSKPAVKILRRPTSQSTELKSNEIRPKQPIKTLQQREQEYAEARLRILGSAKNPEDELEGLNNPKVVTKTSEIPDDNNQYPIIRISGDTIPTSIQNGQIRTCDNIILRMPRGPDGTSGFNVRR